MDKIIATLVMTHITIVCVTLYLHRCQAHQSIDLHPVLSHFMRFWLWLTVGTITKAWVALHRRHHHKSDIIGDPHSPHLVGLWKLFTGGYSVYRDSQSIGLFIKYGKGTPTDAIESFYTRYHLHGLFLMLVIDILLFGLWGLVIWGIQMIWMPFLAAGLINGFGHYYGYRNGNTNDRSHNIFPVGILLCGEELHHNHHLDPANPNFKLKWFEFDLGWVWFKFFRFLGLANLRKKEN